jgi:glycosyltransferase involved in cell wall biosynthesis
LSNPDISVIIPNRNGSATVGRCLEAAFASDHESFEVIVVDDDSADGSVETIRRFPCRLMELRDHAGAAAARNAGSRQARGGILFFTDSDCLLEKQTLRIAQRTLEGAGSDAVIGGTYTREPPDTSFYSVFQSVFINYFETKSGGTPDYVATHAMAIHAATFARQGGFPEHFLPILEDVEFSHRLRRSGCELLINPEIVVRHIFNYSLSDSLKNAWRKSMYWTMYSVRNRDLLADSGTASRELKLNVALCFLCLTGLFLRSVAGGPFLSYVILAAFTSNLLLNRGLLGAFFSTGGARFGLAASAYYFSLYPFAVGAGALSGLLKGSRGWPPEQERP